MWLDTSTDALPAGWAERLAVPAIAAPMTAVSGPELVVAACRSGVIGCFPTHNAGSAAELASWFARIADGVAAPGLHAERPAPVAANLVVHRSNARLQDDLAAVVRAGVEVVVASVGSPEHVVGPLHDAGILVLADVASLRHADKAVAAGVDGLVLLTAGAGGQTGSLNPFSFVRAVRSRYDGLVVLAGGISDGTGIAAARLLGADLVHLGTRFLATRESRASAAYKQAVVDAGLDDVTTSTQVSGLAANVLTSWLTRQQASAGGGFSQDRLLAADDVWAAGHSVAGSHAVLPVAALVEQLRTDYEAAVRPLAPSRT